MKPYFIKHCTGKTYWIDACPKDKCIHKYVAVNEIDIMENIFKENQPQEFNYGLC